MDLYDIFYKNIELFGDGGKVYGKLTTTSFDAHTATRVRCTGVGCSFFAARQRTNQESAPRRSLLDLPFRATLQSGTREVKCTFILLFLNFCQHAWQVEEARVFALKCVRVSLTRAHER